MPNDVNTNIFSITYRDYSREVSTVRVSTREQADNAAYVSARNGLISALDAITLGQEQGHQSVEVTSTSALPSSDSNAAREDKWLVRYSDDVTGKVWRVSIPCRDDTAVTYQQNSDFVDLTAGAAATFVTQFEAFVASPDGNDVTVQSMERVGRNV